jgi:hypothetical protein
VRNTRRTRPNPITFDNRFEVDGTPEMRERVRERIRVDKDRAKASILSPAKHRAIEQATINSPHNFRVLLGGWRREAYAPLDAQRLAQRGMVTLHMAKHSLMRAVSFGGDAKKSESVSIFTAFTYLHRFGDRVLDDLSISYGGTDPDFLEDQVLRFLRLVFYGYPSSLEQAGGKAANLARLLQACRDAYVEACEMIDTYGSAGLVQRYINTHVNSKMVREGYSSSYSQALADVFPLCELTPPNRPLFLPFDAQRMGRETFWKVSAQQAETLTKYGEQMNVRFRAFYNALVPALYGGVVEIL